MQIGIDLGASKIESVILDEQGNEKHRERVDCPKNYDSIIEQIKKIVSDIKNPTKVRFFISDYLLFQQNHLFCLPIFTRYNAVHVYSS